MSSKEELISQLKPILDFLTNSNITNSLVFDLEAEFPIISDRMQQIKSMCLVGINEGWLCPRDAGNLSYGRLAKS